MLLQLSLIHILLGGELAITYTQKGDVWMRGGAEEVFEGVIPFNEA